MWNHLLLSSYHTCILTVFASLITLGGCNVNNESVTNGIWPQLKPSENELKLSKEPNWAPRWSLNMLNFFYEQHKYKEPHILTNALEQDDSNKLGAFERHPCRRICQVGQSLTCYYKLVVHHYQRLGSECKRCQYDEKECALEQCIFGDGVPSTIMAVNGMVPAPAIEACENDTLVIDVMNQLTEATAIHWHGMGMLQSPDMDGTPFVTQYLIQPAEIYRYAFRADRSGTVWYHSQQGWQRALGLAGSLVIRQHLQANRHAQLYDYDLIEHTLIIGDIFYHYNFNKVSNILINGKGRNHLTMLPDNDARHRYERLRVSPGYRYRMRVINNGVFNCPIEFAIEQHRMLIISSDGNDIVPVLADSFFLASGERFDFVLEANQYTNNYWIRARGHNNCSANNLYQGAVLHYRGGARSEPPLNTMQTAKFGQRKEQSDRKMVVVNMPAEYNSMQEHDKKVSSDPRVDSIDVATSVLQSLTTLQWPRYTKFLTYYTSFGMRTERDGALSYQIDDITFATPGLALLQARHLYQDDEYFCNITSLLAEGHDCVRDYCECTNVMRLPAYKPIELVVVNYLTSTQPYHMHGYTFRVVGQGVIGSVGDLRQVSELDRRGLLQRSPADFPAVEKDSIQIPALGYIIVRFMTDNPGFWLHQCGIQMHAISGMTGILKVGENYQMKATPPKVRC